jgi:hypothetical protein
MGRIPHGIKLGLDRFTKVHIERRQPYSSFRQEKEKELERLDAIFADATLDRAFQVIDRALKIQPDSQQMVAGLDFCYTVNIQWDNRCLPKETGAQRQNRHKEIAKKIQELTPLLREERANYLGSKNGDVTYADLANMVEGLTKLRTTFKKGLDPLIEYVFPGPGQRITEGSADNIFFCKLTEWFYRWTGEDHPGHVKAIVKACLKLDRAWSEDGDDDDCEDVEFLEIEDEDPREKKINRRAESARKYQHNNRAKE